MERTEWYQGTADAVNNCLKFNLHGQTMYILAGDHLFTGWITPKMVEYHWENKADVTVAVQPVGRDEAHVLDCSRNRAAVKLSILPKSPRTLPYWINWSSRQGSDKPYLASMGIYLFNLDTLIDMLTLSDEGRISTTLAMILFLTASRMNRKVYGYEYEGYWRDIGTICSFYETNLINHAQPWV